ncbi:MAG: hypothetical protein K9I85_12805 [Saprospiraceae bacterium]|nr:hypothetical protein [Saprospiraceae bacterium]
MPVIWYTASITKIASATPRVRRIWLTLPDNAPDFSFQAGQFITMDLPIGEKRLQRWRSYSIASAPNGRQEIELCIVRMPDGLASEYLFTQVEVGTSIRFKGPDGAFVLPDKIDQDLIMVCTGTGVAPFRSMLLDLDQRDWPDRKIHLIYGSRTREDLLYADEFLELASRRPNFQFTATLSRIEDNPSESWVKKGYVHAGYEKLYADPLPDRKFLLCGWTNMIDTAVEKLLIQMGYARDQVGYELYG